MECTNQSRKIKTTIAWLHSAGRNRFSLSSFFGRLEMPKAPSWKAPAAQVAMPRSQTPAPAPSPRFEACLPDTLSQECPHPNDWSDPANFSDDPHDPGGATMCGITQSEYDTYRESLDESEQSVKLISQAEGQAIYQMSYWQPHCPQLPTGLDLSFFDSSVNMGPEEAIRILQSALNINADGIWGPQTAGAVADIVAVKTVIEAFTARREAVYRTFSTFQFFGADWIRRATEIGNESIQMIAAA
jgi:Glycosyl hydrolase 108